MAELVVTCTIVDKEELFDKMSNAETFYHALELFHNSKHIVLTIAERVRLLNVANSRLRTLYISGVKLGDENDPYRRIFYSHSRI